MIVAYTSASMPGAEPPPNRRTGLPLGISLLTASASTFYGCVRRDPLAVKAEGDLILSAKWRALGGTAMKPFHVVHVLVAPLAGAFLWAAPSEAQTPDDRTVCQLESGVAPLVSLSWREQPKEGGVNRLNHDLVTLIVRNNSSEPQLAHVTLSRYGNQEHGDLRRPLSLWLPANGHRPIPLVLRKLGFRPEMLDTSASLRAHVETEGLEWTGDRWQLVYHGQSLSPTLYFHGEPAPDGGRTELLVYGNEVKVAEFNAGDVRGERLDDLREALATIGRTPFPLTVAASMDPGGGAKRPDDVVFGGPGSGNQTFCVRIPFATEDSGVGEDFFAGPGTQWLPASYTRIHITNFNFGSDSVVVDDGRLDADGCISFDHTPTSDVWSVIILSQADVPRSDQPTDHNRFFSLDSGGNVSTWFWHGELDPLHDVEYFYVDGDDRSNIFIAGVFSLVRFSDGLSDETLYAMDDACPTAANNSCNGTFTTIDNEEIPVAYIHPDHNAHKFAISHEMGHAVVYRFFHDNHPAKSNMYDLNTGGPECVFDAGAHALHSEEHSASALTEGFAQFYATAVWNDTTEQDGAFHYYKDDYKNGTVQDVDMADGPLGGEDAYLRNVCTGDDAAKAGHGVELDWARQLWDYRTRPGNAPMNLEILQQYGLAVNEPGFFGWSLGNSSQRMLDGIDEFDTNNGTHFLPRWGATDHANGIDY
jgi:hypothetical protein